MKVCQNCGHENSDKGKFCEECGAKLVEAPKFCPECGTKLEGTPKFCPECGSNLAEDTEVSDDDEHEDDSLDSDDDGESSENPFGGLVKAFKAFSALNDDDNESDDYDEEYAEDDEDENEDDETTEEKIREIVDKYINVIAKDNMWYRSAAVAKPEHAQVFQNVRANIAKDVSQSEILGFIDTTIFGKGKTGLVFTTEALYENSAGALWRVPYYRMYAMNCNGKKIVFEDTDDCGIGWLKRGMDISIDSTWYNIPALKDCLEEITAII